MTGCLLSILISVKFTKPSVWWFYFSWESHSALDSKCSMYLFWVLTLILNTVHTYNIFCIAAFSTVAERYCKAPTTRVQGPLAFEREGETGLVQAKHRVSSVSQWLCVRKGSRAPTLTSKIHQSVPLFSSLPLIFKGRLRPEQQFFSYLHN